MSENHFLKFGSEIVGELKKVMLHCPEDSIGRINEQNIQFYLFNSVPQYDRYLQEHKAYRDLLIRCGVEVFELSDYIVENRELMTYLPNLAYLNDIGVVTSKGAILSTMCPGGRQYEEIVVREALSALGIPVLYDCKPGEQLEGFITLLPDTLFIADTERHSRQSLERFFPFALQHFENIVYAEIPQARRFMHPDMIFGKISDNLGLVYLPAFINCWHIQKNTRKEVDFVLWLKDRKMELIHISDTEQQNWATSFVTLKPNHILNYDISLEHTTQNQLEALGVRLTQFHPDALLAGGGSLRCLTMRLLRE